jgi:hypothetical protein
VGYHPVAVELQLHYSVHHSTANNIEEKNIAKENTNTRKTITKGKHLKEE